MKRRVRIILLVLLYLLMQVVSTTACINVAEPEVSSSEGKPEEKFELTIYNTCIRGFSPDSPIANTIKEKLNVKLKFITMPVDIKADVWLETKIASGQIPDYVSNVFFSYYPKYVKQGVFAQLPLKIIKKSAPRLKSWAEDEAGRDVWKFYGVNGLNYALPVLWSLGPKWDSMAIREDWLHQVGINKIPETLEEMEVVFDKFKNELNKPYAFTGLGVESLTWVFAAYGVYPFIFTQKEGSILRGEVTPEAKEALTILNRWYSKGYIDPEFIVQKLNNMKNKWRDGNYGVAQTCWPDIVPGGAFYDPLIEKDHDASVTQMLFPKGPEGERGIIQTSPIWAAFCFGRHMEDNIPKLEKYLEFFDYCSQDESIRELINQGIENKTFRYTKDGEYYFIPPYDNETERVKYGIGIPLEVDFHNYKLIPYSYRSPFKDFTTVEKTEAMNNGKYDIMRPISRPVFSMKGKQLDDFSRKSIIDFITGKRPLSEFNMFVDEWYDKMSGREIMKEAQHYYDLFKND